MSSLYKVLVEWYTSYDDRAKLQHSYVILSLITLVLAGLVGLVNYQYGQTILQLVYGGLAIFLINAFVWAVLDSLVFTHIKKKAHQTKQK